MKVTCLCLTRNRREWLPEAIACYEAQTYQDIELLIVADEESDVEGLIPPYSRIRVIVTGHLSIGEKRNIGCANATGEIIAHFDDDDHSTRDRVAGQVQRLIDTGKSVTAFHSMKFSDGTNWFQYHGDPSFGFDTSLCYFKAFWEKHEFGHINDGLEAGFRAAAIREGQFISVDAGDLMFASIHQGNTGPRVMTPGSSSWQAI